MNTIDLIKKLINIPSFVSDTANEVKIGDFIYDYLKRNTGLIVKKEPVLGRRANIIAYTPSCKSQNRLQVDLLLIDHIDTVEPKSGWATDQFRATTKQGRLYGLGSFDTKSGVAILMNLARLVKHRQRIMLLFYIDEEYDFEGMKQFIKDYQNRLMIKKTISLDGEDMQLRSEGRGLLDLKIVCQGRTGHSANPQNGLSTIMAFNQIINLLKPYLEKQIKPRLGCCSMNIAYLKAGLLLKQNRNKITLGQNGNNLPDYLETILEFRTVSQRQNMTIQIMLRRLIKKTGLKLIDFQIRHNLFPWYSKRTKWQDFEKVITGQNLKLQYEDASLKGYVDIAFIANSFNCPCICIGAIGGNGHGINEWVSINSIRVLEKVMEQYLLLF